MPENQLFESEQLDNTVVITVTSDLGEFEMDGDPATIFDQLARLTDGCNVVVDLSRTDYFGSSAIGMLTRLVKHVQDNSKRIAFCNLSEHEQEVISITHLDEIWDVKSSKDAALQFVTESAVP